MQLEANLGSLTSEPEKEAGMAVSDAENEEEDDSTSESSEEEQPTGAAVVGKTIPTNSRAPAPSPRWKAAKKATKRGKAVKARMKTVEQLIETAENGEMSPQAAMRSLLNHWKEATREQTAYQEEIKAELRKIKGLHRQAVAKVEALSVRVDELVEAMAEAQQERDDENANYYDIEAEEDNDEESEDSEYFDSDQSESTEEDSAMETEDDTEEKTEASGNETGNETEEETAQETNEQSPPALTSDMIQIDETEANGTFTQNALIRYINSTSSSIVDKEQAVGSVEEDN